MSPLEVRIMVHYYVLKGDLEMPDKFMEELEAAGMLELAPEDPDQTNTAVWVITKKGKAYVHKLCSIPIPTESITYTFEEI